MIDHKSLNRLHRTWKWPVILILVGHGIAFGNPLLAIKSKQTGEKSKSQQADLSGERGRSEAYFHFSLARDLEEDGKFVQALEEFKKAVQADPQSASLRVELAYAYLRHRRIRDAVQEAENGIRLDANNLEAHKILGQIHYSMITNEDLNKGPASSESLKRAIQEYETVLRLDPSDPSPLLTLSSLYRYDGQTDKAISTLNKYLGMVPSSEAALGSLAQIYSDQGNYKEAINVFKKALEVNPDSPRILEELAYTYEQSKDYKNAIETYRKALNADEDSLDLRRGLAQALLEDGEDQSAEKEYLKILEADPDEGIAYLRLGQIYRKRLDFDKALENFNKANSILVNSLEVPFYIATLYEELGKFEKAQERFQHLLKLSAKQDHNYSASEAQNRAVFLTHAGYVAQQLGSYTEAINYFNELRTLSPDNELKADGYIIDTYRTSRQMDKALATAEASLNEHSGDADMRVLYDDLLAESGKSDQAIKDLEGLLKNNDEDFKIYYALIQIYQRDKKFEEAEKVAFKAEKDFKSKESFYFTLGSLYERQKEYDKAEETFKKVLALNPKHAPTLNYWGYMLADRGVRLEQSLDLIKRAVDLDPNNGAYLDSLGWAYFKLNQLSEAEKYLKKAQERVRRDPTIHDHLGDLYYQNSQYDEAQKAWESSIANHQDDEEMHKVQKKLDDLKVKLASLQKK
ncbi:MAG TPA: tetratricopeptide repeat protein [Terriglobia bacterium]|nr:tetratricopeptide repeat protein [Terriglobia bacterium]